MSTDLVKKGGNTSVDAGSEGRPDGEKKREVFALGEGRGRVNDTMDKIQASEGVSKQGERGGPKSGGMCEGASNGSKLSTEDSAGVGNPTGVDKVCTRRGGAVERGTKKDTAGRVLRAGAIGEVGGKGGGEAKGARRGVRGSKGGDERGGGGQGSEGQRGRTWQGGPKRGREEGGEGVRRRQQ